MSQQSVANQKFNKYEWFSDNPDEIFNKLDTHKNVNRFIELAKHERLIIERFNNEYVRVFASSFNAHMEFITCADNSVALSVGTCSATHGYNIVLNEDEERNVVILMDTKQHSAYRVIVFDNKRNAQKTLEILKL